jgi:hypothetical protein
VQGAEDYLLEVFKVANQSATDVCKLLLNKNIFLFASIIGGQPAVHVAPACARSGEGSNHFASIMLNENVCYVKFLLTLLLL